jgi:hypothetical protein
MSSKNNPDDWDIEEISKSVSNYNNKYSNNPISEKKPGKIAKALKYEKKLNEELQNLYASNRSISLGYANFYHDDSAIAIGNDAWADVGQPNVISGIKMPPPYNPYAESTTISDKLLESISSNRPLRVPNGKSYIEVTFDIQSNSFIFVEKPHIHVSTREVNSKKTMEEVQILFLERFNRPTPKPKKPMKEKKKAAESYGDKLKEIRDVDL